MHLVVRVEIVPMAINLLMPANRFPVRPIEVIPSTIRLDPVPCLSTLGIVVAFRAIFPGNNAPRHSRSRVEVVPATIQLLAPAQAHGRGRVEVVLHPVEAAPAGEGAAVPVEEALGAVLPGHPSLHHLRVRVEVVPGAVQLLAPAQAHGRGRVEVVLHPVEAAPAGEGAAVPVEEALGAVLPGHPPCLHAATIVEEVPAILDLLTTGYSQTIGTEIVANIVRNHPGIDGESSIGILIAKRGSFREKTALSLVRNDIARVFGIIGGVPRVGILGPNLRLG